MIPYRQLFGFALILREWLEFTVIVELFKHNVAF